jgi:hypothetical protein
MFERTVVTLGELVRDDVELGTLYIFLNLLTPSSAASSTTKVTKKLTRVTSGSPVCVRCD